MFDMSQSAEKTAPTGQEKIRRCLLCAENFESEWAGERICAKCRARAAWKQG
ncbi:MAG: hypothetical protein GY791_00495 [Alphaproteobacteria bacterium]|nr:hypothetical protein [Alphaproteobacteria bacterium]